MSEPATADDALIEEAIAALPQIGRRFLASVCQLPEMAELSMAQVKLMGFLYLEQDVHGGQCTIGDVAHGLGLSMPAASEMVERMVEDGLVERTTNPADRRQVLVRLTAAARQRGDRMHDLRREQLSRVFAQLAPDERSAFVRGLRLLTDVLSPNPCELAGAVQPAPRTGQTS